MNDYLVELLSNPAPAVWGCGMVMAPMFHEIQNAIQAATLLNMTELPAALATYVPASEPAA